MPLLWLLVPLALGAGVWLGGKGVQSAGQGVATASSGTLPVVLVGGVIWLLHDGVK